MHLVIDIEKDIPLLGIIEIVRVPVGEAPLEIREQWVGVQMSYLYFDPQNTFPGIITERRPDASYEAYVVLEKHAFAALKNFKRPALDWWEKKGFFEGSSHSRFSFRAEEIKVIKSTDFSKSNFRY